MECAYLDTDGNMVIERLQHLAHLRPDLTRLEEECELGEAIVITSGKGGVGKTTTSANLGTALAI